jgi:glutamyl-tRNA synthetase
MRLAAPPVPPVGRLAPSPTGAQHIGNARTYLITWLSVRSRGGRLVLRIEDIDSPRIKPGADRQIMDDLRWLGLDWDEGPYYQTKRLHLYEQALVKLQNQEFVYPCTCTRSDIEEAASAPHAEHEGPAYPGTCAGRRAVDARNLDRPFAWRFRSSLNQATFVDGVAGPVTVPLSQAGDFVVWKSSGTPAYQLAVVVDDAAMGVTEVVRGDDLIPSTPRQLQLYASLGLSAPCFAHVPLVVGPDGRRLAKRHGDTRLAALREQNVQPEALLGLLAWSCGWLPAIEPIALAGLLPLFRWETIPRPSFVLTAELLKQINFCSAPGNVV